MGLTYQAMRLQPHFTRVAAGFAACVTLFLFPVQPGWAQAESPALLPDPLVEELLLEWQAQQAALELLQAQQAATLQAVELSRTETAIASAKSVELTLARLDAMHGALAAQREHDLGFIRNSNRRVLTVVSGLVGLLFLGMLLVTIVSTRAMNRLTVALSSLPFAHSQLNAPTPAGLLSETGAAHLQNAIERLEHRIAGLENHSGSQPPPESHETKDHSAELLSEPQTAHR